MNSKSKITDDVRQLIEEVAAITASKVCAVNDAGQINYYKAMESLLNNYTRLAALVEDEAKYTEVELQTKSKSIVTFKSGSAGYLGTKTDDEIIDELQRQRAVQYHKTKARFDEVDRVIRLFENRKEFNVVRMYYFNEDAQGNKRNTDKRYTFEEIAEELDTLGLLKDEKTARKWRSRIVSDMAVCMFGSVAAIEAGRKREKEKRITRD